MRDLHLTTIFLAFLLAFTALAPKAGARATRREQPKFRDGTILVGFLPNVSIDQQIAILYSVGAREAATIGAATHVVRVPPGQVLTIVEKLKKIPGIRYAEPDWIQHVDGGAVPNDPSFGLQWALQNTGQTIAGDHGTPWSRRESRTGVGHLDRISIRGGCGHGHGC